MEYGYGCDLMVCFVLYTLTHSLSSLSSFRHDYDDKTFVP